MTVATKKVQGRRTVRYESLDEVLAEAEQLASQDVRTLGNWNLGQIVKHVGQALDTSIDGAGFTLPAPVRWVMTLLMKKKFLTKAIPAGFKSPKEFIPPEETSAEEGLAVLRKAIERQRSESSRAIHPAFGKISAKEWNDFMLRHAELHMSFVIPEKD